MVGYKIIGASRCGKTTFLSLLAGLDLPSKGEIIFNEKSTRELNRDDLRRDHAAAIYQAYNLFPLLTATENVTYPLKLHGVSKDKSIQTAHDELNSVGLTNEYYERYPSMLSGGEQQRVAIARALATGGEVILAYEPTGNLDLEYSENIIEALKKLAHDENYCVIVVTHDSSIAAEADEVLKMSDGRIVG